MEPFDVDARELAVEVAAVRWRAPDSDFAVVVGITAEGEEVVAVGALGHVHEGEEVELAGAWQEHARHGWRFAARQARLRPPSSEEALLAYLGSIKHVGPRGAQWLLDHHGPGEVLAAIDRDPAGALRGVPGIGRARIGPAVSAWEEQGAQRAVRLLLEEHGVPGAVAARVYRTFGPGTMELLRTDPYQLTDVEGIGFVSADALAQALGTAHDDPGRLDAGLRHALREAERDGHCHLPRSELEQRAARLLGEDAAPRIDALATAGRLVVDGDRVLHPAMARAEGNLARHVRELLEDEPALRLGEVERPSGHLAPSDDQWAVVETVLARRLAILTGGPGTGKCVAPGTLVVVDGDLVPIDQLWRDCAGEPAFDGEGYWATPTDSISVAAIGPSGQILVADVGRVYRQRVSELGRRVRLSDGSTLVMTNRHRLLGVDGWTDDLQIGAWVCVPRRLRHSGSDLPSDVTTLLAWQIAEGNEPAGARKNTARITQKDTRRLERLRDAATALGAREQIEMGSMSITNPPTRTPHLTITSAAYREYLEGLGHRWGALSNEKEIPTAIMRAGDRTVRLFLREFFAAEGSASADRRTVELTSASPKLIAQLQSLLRRFGVWMRARSVMKAATNGHRIKRPYVTGTISGPSLRQFAVEVGFVDPLKEARLFNGAAVVSNTNNDVVPVSDLLWRLRASTGLSRHYFGLTSSYFTSEKQPSRETCERVLAHVEAILDGSAEAAHEARITALTGRGGHRDKASTRRAFATMNRDEVAVLAARMRERLEREVNYCRIIEVEPLQLEGWVYDLEVPGAHNYVAGGMLCHNTATMRSLVDLLREHKRTVRLCAPTGKAARRLSETTGALATTIHRLLEYQPHEGFGRDADDPIPGTDLLVVDEASMLDVRLAQALFAAVGPKTHVLLVGDPDQLASVGAGRVLDDLLESGAVPTVRLTEIFRQAARSLIVRAAHAIDAGEPPPTEAGPDDVRDFFLVTRSGADAIRDEVVALASGRLAGHLGVDPRSGVLVLAPMHRGPAGIDMLNDRLRALLNPHGSGIGGTGLRVGDRVIQTVNDHEHELMNGELGVLEHHDRDRDRVLLACDDGRRLTLGLRDLGTLRLAHAISIHKAQGSQAPGIVVVLHRGHSHMLTRNLLYTAVTRAERACVVVGEPAALHTALGRRDSHARHTRLRELVQIGR